MDFLALLGLDPLWQKGHGQKECIQDNLKTGKLTELVKDMCLVVQGRNGQHERIISVDAAAADRRPGCHANHAAFQTQVVQVQGLVDGTFIDAVASLVNGGGQVKHDFGLVKRNVLPGNGRRIRSKEKGLLVDKEGTVLEGRVCLGRRVIRELEAAARIPLQQGFAVLS